MDEAVNVPYTQLYNLMIIEGRLAAVESYCHKTKYPNADTIISMLGIEVRNDEPGE